MLQALRNRWRTLRGSTENDRDWSAWAMGLSRHADAAIADAVRLAAEREVAIRRGVARRPPWLFNDACVRVQQRAEAARADVSRVRRSRAVSGQGDGPVAVDAEAHLDALELCLRELEGERDRAASSVCEYNAIAEMAVHHGSDEAAREALYWKRQCKRRQMALTREVERHAAIMRELRHAVELLRSLEPGDPAP